ncbi:MAG: cytochrome b/b6 domain-containing protein [Deltaproteobacteria bacterium]
MEHGEDVRVVVDSWDWETRLLHWINMLLIVTLILLIIGKEGMEVIGIDKTLRAPVKKLHAYIGHVFAITFFLRVIWGFAGNRYARWSDIIPYRRERWRAIGGNIRWYLSGFRTTPVNSAGHDPLASIFYIALFLVLASQVITGMLLSGLELKTFPGVLFVGGMGEAGREALEGALEGAHEFGFLFIIFFICAHIAGLAAHEIKEKTGLFSSMIHGKKYFRKE